jgi:hypothetical protein
MDEFPFTRSRSANVSSLFSSNFPSHRMTPALLSHLLLANRRTRRHYGLAARGLQERIVCWNVISRCYRLRNVFKRLIILGIAGLTFVLGANYLLVYTLKQQMTRERERQDRTYWSAFNAVEQFGEHADQVSEQKAKAALDEARQKGLSKIRARILQNYLEDLEHCYQGDRESCKKANTDMNEAIRVPAERK